MVIDGVFDGSSLFLHESPPSTDIIKQITCPPPPSAQPLYPFFSEDLRNGTRSDSKLHEGDDDCYENEEEHS